jgi:hypothetical protein
MSSMTAPYKDRSVTEEFTRCITEKQSEATMILDESAYAPMCGFGN